MPPTSPPWRTYRHDLAQSHNNLGILLAPLGQRPEAEQQCRKALGIREKLAADFPTVPSYQADLGASYCNLGTLIRDGGKPGESLEWYEKAIRILTALHEQDRRQVLAREVLRGSYVGRARAFDLLRKYAEAVKDWDRVIELSPKEKEANWRTVRAVSLVNAGEVAEAAAVVAELTKSTNWNAGQWYNFACVYAIASGKSADHQQEYVERALALLQMAVQVRLQRRRPLERG